MGYHLCYAVRSPLAITDLSGLKLELEVTFYITLKVTNKIHISGTLKMLGTRQL